MMRKIFVFALSMLIAHLSVYAYADKDDIIKAGDNMPFFSVVSNRADTLEFGFLREKPSFLVFFNTRCYDCRRELVEIQKLYMDFGTQMTFLCISRAELSEDVGKYWSDHGLTIPYSAQPDRAVYSLFAKKTIPRVYICLPDGKIFKTFKGNTRKKRLEKVIRDIINIEKSNQ